MLCEPSMEYRNSGYQPPARDPPLRRDGAYRYSARLRGYPYILANRW